MNPSTDIQRWLEIHEPGHLAPAFERNHITVDRLPTLTGGLS